VPERLGPFLITGVLGTGGSAVVYAAVHDDQPVALKVPHDELSPKQQHRFLQEAGMLARVRHPAIVEVLDAGRLPDDRPYLAMRRYEGETLAVYLEREGALDLRHALRLFDELADAAAALHDDGLVHRDIKPENVLLVEGAEHVVLLDLGIAKDLDAPASTTTQAGIAKGTPAVMAPERFFGAAASTRTDVYELAVVLYVMLVGRSPWSESADAAARLNPALPSELGVELPSALSEQLMRALSTRPEVRPSNARELAACVREAAITTEALPPRVTAAIACDPVSPKAGETSSGAVQVLDRPGSQDVGRHSWRRIAAVVGVVLGVTAGALLAVRWSDTDAAPVSSATEGPAAPGRSTMELSPVAHEWPQPAEPDEEAPVAAHQTSRALTPASVARVAASVASSSPAPKPPPVPTSAPTGKPKGAPCTRSSECASMLCAAERCQ
jgi:serine/threonine-protein kinase